MTIQEQTVTAVQVFVGAADRLHDRVEEIIDGLTALGLMIEAPALSFRTSLCMPEAVLARIRQAHAFVMFFDGPEVTPAEASLYYEALKQKQRRPDFILLPVALDGVVPGLPELHKLPLLNASGLNGQSEVLAHISKVLEGHGPLPGALPGGVFDARTPWKYFQPFNFVNARGHSDSAFFIKREGLVDTIVERIRVNEQRVITLIGNSGAGKTSLIEGGVFPVLKRQLMPVTGEGSRGIREWPSYLRDSDSWLYLTMKPGLTPVRELVSQFADFWYPDSNKRAKTEMVERWTGYLRHGGQIDELVTATRAHLESEEYEVPSRVVIFVDQLEEIYTMSRSAEARRFSELLGAAAESSLIFVIAALRSNYYGALQGDPVMFKSCARFDVPPLRGALLASALTMPCHKLGVGFEQEAELKALVNAGHKYPEGLALLNAQMTELWALMQARKDETIRVPDRAFWEMLNLSLEQRAEAFIERHGDRFEVLKGLCLKKLLAFSPQGRPITRRLRKSRCTAEEWRFIEAMALPETGLVQIVRETGEPAAEYAHEVILRHWPRLEAWINEEQDFDNWLVELGYELQQWENAKRAGTHCLTGLKLARAQSWLKIRHNDLTAEQRAFINISARRAKRYRSRKIRQWRLYGALATLVAIGVGLSAMTLKNAVSKMQLAERAANRSAALARVKEGRALSERNAAMKTQSAILADLSFRAVRSGDAVSGMLLAMEALPDQRDKLQRPFVVKAEAALYQALYARRELDVLRGHRHFVLSALYSPDGKRIVSASYDHTARLWDAVTHRTIAVLTGHKGIVWSAEFNRDGSRIVTASEDGTARIWNGVTGKLLHVLKGHKDGVIRAGFTPDGRHVVTTSEDGTTRVWDVASGKMLHVLKGHVSYVVALAFDPVNHRLATGSYDLTARVWNGRTGEKQALLKGHQGYVVDVGFNYDGSLVVTASLDATARIWDAWSGAELVTLSGHSRAVQSARFSPDGTRIVTASGDHTARVWDVQTGRMLLVLEGHKDTVYHAEFSADGETILTSSADRTARIWDAKSGAELAVLAGHDGYVRARYSPDMTRVVSASGDRTVRIWDATPGGMARILDARRQKPAIKGVGGITALAFSPTLQHKTAANSAATTGSSRPVSWLASGTRSGRVLLWDRQTGKLMRVLKGHKQAVTDVKFSPDGRWLLSTGLDNTARLWAPGSGRLLAVIRGRSGLVTAKFSPDGRYLLSYSGSDDVKLFDALSGDLIRRWPPGKTGAVLAAAFSPDSRSLAIAATGQPIMIYDIQTGKLQRKFAGPGGVITRLVFSHNGKMVLTARQDNILRLWQVASGRLIRKFPGQKGIVKTVSFSPDDSRILVAAHENSARLWSLRTGRQIAVMPHEFKINSAWFSPDGRKLVSASDDGTARLWDGWTGAQLAVLRGHTDIVTTARFAPDGRLVATGSKDGTLRLWPVFPTTQDLLSYTKRIIPRCLSRKQRRKYYLPPQKPQWCDRFKRLRQVRR